MATEVPPKIRTNDPDPSLSEQGLERLSEEERRLFLLLVPPYKKSAIPLSSFEGHYDSGMIAKDTAYVIEKERQFKADENPELAHFQRRAELLEALTREAIKKDNWLGPEARPITASRYDDIKNGVDLIVDLIRKEGINRLALSVDVTSNVTSLEQKLGKIKDGILKGELTYVKYCISSDGNRQEIRNVPRVVIGADAALIRELSFLRLEVHTCVQALKKNQESGGGLSRETVGSLESRGKQARSKLAKHRIQLLIIDQIELQVRTFAEFAARNNQTQIVKEYERTLEIIKGIYEEKSVPGNKRSMSVSAEERDANNNDGVYRALKSGLKIFQ